MAFLDLSQPDVDGSKLWVFLSGGHSAIDGGAVDLALEVGAIPRGVGGRADACTRRAGDSCAAAQLMNCSWLSPPTCTDATCVKPAVSNSRIPATCRSTSEPQAICLNTSSSRTVLDARARVRSTDPPQDRDVAVVTDEPMRLRQV